MRVVCSFVGMFFSFEVCKVIVIFKFLGFVEFYGFLKNVFGRVV